MPTFHVRQVVSLEIEVEAEDALTAVSLIDDAFSRADPIGSPNVRLVLSTAQGLIPSARVLDATPQALALLVEHDANRSSESRGRDATTA